MCMQQDESYISWAYTQIHHPAIVWCMMTVWWHSQGKRSRQFPPQDWTVTKIIVGSVGLSTSTFDKKSHFSFYEKHSVASHMDLDHTGVAHDAPPDFRGTWGGDTPPPETLMPPVLRSVPHT